MSARHGKRRPNVAAARGIRVVNLRIGLVLSATGGAMATSFTPFKAGIGGTIGDGSQFWSWIALDDLMATVLHAINEETLAGAVNAVSPARLPTAISPGYWGA